MSKARGYVTPVVCSAHVVALFHLIVFEQQIPPLFLLHLHIRRLRHPVTHTSLRSFNYAAILPLIGDMVELRGDEYLSLKIKHLGLRKYIVLEGYRQDLLEIAEILFEKLAGTTWRTFDHPWHLSLRR